MSEPNWNIFINIAVSLVVGLGVNLITPTVQKWLDRWSLSSRGKTLKRLQADHARVTAYRNDPTSLQLMVNSLLVKGFSGLFLIVLMIAISPFLASTGWFLVLMLLIPFIAIIVFQRLMQLDDDLTRVRRFEEFEAKTLARISELQASVKSRRKQAR
ncbi:hypothetical protein ANRL2_01965 [Anaerolineae bacterium]|nr:hypothetical protein ANRL2_01965 [Anaerolineae bacterium]